MKGAGAPVPFEQVASKGQARLITYSVILLNLVFIMLSIGLLSGEGAFGTLGDVSRPVAPPCTLRPRLWAYTAGGRGHSSPGLSCRSLLSCLQFRPLYRAQLVLASICLGLLLIMLLRLGLSFRRSKVERRVW